MRELTLQQFVDLNRVECYSKFNVTADYVYNKYYNDVYPNRHLVTKYLNLDDKAITHEELKVVFGLGHRTWKAVRYFFKEFDVLLGHKKSIMKIRSEMRLQEGLDLAPSNPKLIEMELRLYNDDYKDKGVSMILDIPTEIKISFDDGSRTEEDLKDGFKEQERKEE